MFNKASFAAVAALASFAVASPAVAATVVYETGSDIALTIDPLTGVAEGEFVFSVVNAIAGDPNGNFTATFTFDSPFLEGLASADASNSYVGGNVGEDVNFTSVFLNGQAGSVINAGKGSFAFVFDAPAFFGTGNTLTFNGVLNPTGNRTGNAEVTGSLNVTAVPEPGTWALLILGFGALGSAMRRRTSRVTATKATLNFA